MKKELKDRLERLEREAAPNAIRIWYSTENPFPIKWDERTPARNFAYAELNDAWNERAAREARASYDTTKYVDFIPVLLTDALGADPAERISSFRRALENGEFTEPEYTTEYFAAVAWSERHGFAKPTNFLTETEGNL